MNIYIYSEHSFRMKLKIKILLRASCNNGGPMAEHIANDWLER